MPTAPALLFFDGECNLCHWFVQFVVRHDPQGRYHFAALQSESARTLLPANARPLAGSTSADLESVVLLEGNQVYTHSAAVLRVVRQLGGVWRLAALGWLLPRCWRDAAYRYVARHRYRWFGRQEQCLLPTAALQARFK